ncbi:MAG: hypothetical protein WA828_00620 [Coleofasciculaceae cyanobacterium]
MRISIAACTLTALAASELSVQAETNSNLTLTLPETSSFLNENSPSSIKSSQTKAEIPLNAIAPPEIETNLSDKTGAVNFQAIQKPSNLVVENAVKFSTASVDIFTPYLDKIRDSLPPGLVIRLPSQVSLSDNFKAINSQYYLDISPQNTQPELLINIFSCPEKSQSCFVGSLATRSKNSVNLKQELNNYNITSPSITLANNFQGYLLEEPNSEQAVSLIWEQDNQFYTVKLSAQERQNLIPIVNSVIQATPIQNLPETTSTKLTNPTRSPLNSRQPILATADQLRQGEVLTTLRYRQSFPPGNDSQTGLTGQPTLGINWGVTNNLELTFDAQTVDNSGPVRQGPFLAQRINPDGTGPNFFQEFTLQAKQRIWQNETGTQALSGVVAASLGNAGRPYRFYQPTRAVANGQNNQIVTSLELPFTYKPTERLQFTLSPKVAFLPEDNALYFNILPLTNSSFGTTFGLAGGVSYQINPRLLLWGDAFVPLTGNNTINRDTGSPTKTVAFNAGLRYLVNPRLATDLFVSNTLGNTGALSLVADREYPSLGIGITYLPGITGANQRLAQHFNSTQQPPPDTSAGFALLDGGTIANKQLNLSVQGGSQGLLTGVRYGLLDDLEIGTFLNSVPGIIDESELGFSGKIRFLHQADGDPFTLSGAVTVARANNVLVNLVNNNRNRFQELGLEKGGFAFSDEKVGELFIITLSAPMQYQFKGGSAVWLTPTLGFIQRNGLQMAGFNFGGSVPLTKDLEAIAEAGYDFSGKGNAFVGNKRATIIPWSVGLRWRPASLLGIPEKSAIAGLQLEAYLTNRVGSTPFETMRVRADNNLAVGVGLSLPIQF